MRWKRNSIWPQVRAAKKSHSILTIKGRKQSARSEKKTSPLAIAAIVLKTKQQLRPWANNFWPSEQQKLPCSSNIITTTSSGQQGKKQNEPSKDR
jgi:hypothetical protein